MATVSKDVEMKDVEEDKSKDEKKKEEEPDPKQVQKDKDLLTFEGNYKIPFNAHFPRGQTTRYTRADETGRKGGEPERAQVHP